MLRGNGLFTRDGGYQRRVGGRSRRNGRSIPGQGLNKTEEVEHLAQNNQ